MLYDFIQKRPILAIIVFSVFFGIAKGGYTYFEHDRKRAQIQDAQVQMAEAAKELSKFHVPLTEDKVKQAIKFINLMPAEQIKARTGSKSPGLLGHVFATARAAQEKSPEFNDRWRQAGFTSSKEAVEVLGSVILASTHIVVENAVAKMEATLAEDRKTENAHLLTNKQRRALESRKKLVFAPLKMSRDLIDNLNVPQGNYALVKLHHDEIQSALSRFQR